MPYRVKIAPDGPSFPVPDGQRILTAGRRAGVWLPFECGWGSCATCKVTLVDGDVEHLIADAPARTERDARRRRILACQSTPLSDVTIRPLQVSDRPTAERPTADHDGELVDVREVGPDIRRFTFRLERPALFRAGQYAVTDLGGGLRRCYSMCSAPGSPHVEFLTRRYSGRPGSECLHALPIGARVSVELPYGDMWLRPDPGPVLLIAGGTGVSPILALTGALARIADPRPVRVFYGAAARDELVCWDELSDLVEALPDGRLNGALVEADERWTGATGLVTDAVRERVVEPDPSTRVYLAGPPPMVDATLETLDGLGVQRDRIHYDRFG